MASNEYFFFLVPNQIGYDVPYPLGIFSAMYWTLPAYLLVCWPHCSQRYQQGYCLRIQPSHFFQKNLGQNHWWSNCSSKRRTICCYPSSPRSQNKVRKKALFFMHIGWQAIGAASPFPFEKKKHPSTLSFFLVLMISYSFNVIKSGE